MKSGDMVKQKKEGIKLVVSAHPDLVDAISDYMIGVLDAAVEAGVQNLSGQKEVNGFMEKEMSDQELKTIETSFSAYLRELAEIFNLPCPDIKLVTVANEDWSSSWKKHFIPFQVIPGVTICPTWEDYQPRDKELVITMDPGMAFGTGHHPTTSMSLNLIRKTLEDIPGATVVDVGTGTGVLGIAALLFGAGKVLGIDNDVDAVTAAMANVTLNNLEKNMTVSHENIAELDNEFDLVVANIVHDVLQQLKLNLVNLVRPGGQMVLSGLLAGEQVDSIVTSFADEGMKLIELQTEGEWAALRLKKKP